MLDNATIGQRDVNDWYMRRESKCPIVALSHIKKDEGKNLPSTPLGERIIVKFEKLLFLGEIVAADEFVAEHSGCAMSHYAGIVVDQVFSHSMPSR